MSPWIIAIPVVGGVAYLLFSGISKAVSVYSTIPTVKALVDGGDRARTYLDSLDYAYMAYMGVAVFGGAAAADALKEVVGTLDVVEGMAKNDLADQNITKNDMVNITEKINEIKASVA